MMNLTELSDAELVAGFRDTVSDELEWLGGHLSHLAELDRRKLFFEHGSLRAYLVSEYGIEEDVADRRIRAARMIRRLPFLQAKIETGRLTLTHLEIAQGCAYREKLSDEELTEILEAISGMSTRA